MINDLPAATSNQMVSLDSIDCSPGPYCMSFGFDLNPLILSIRDVGLLNSPILLASDESRKMVVIAGYRRILALKHLGRHTFSCRILQDSTLDPLYFLLINLHENLSTRRLNDVEKAMVLTRMENLAPAKTITERYLPVLDLVPRNDIFLLYKKVANELGETGKRALAEGKLSIQAIKMLLDLDKTVRDENLRFFSNFMLNMNQQRQLIDFIIDISIIEKRSVASLLSDPSIREMETDTRMNPPQKAKAMMALFRKRRLPSVVDAERRFRKNISDLGLPDGVRMIPPAFFEGPDYKMEISFRNGRQLTRIVRQLSTIGGLSDVGDPREKEE